MKTDKLMSKSKSELGQEAMHEYRLTGLMPTPTLPSDLNELKQLVIEQQKLIQILSNAHQSNKGKITEEEYPDHKSQELQPTINSLQQEIAELKNLIYGLVNSKPKN